MKGLPVMSGLLFAACLAGPDDYDLPPPDVAPYLGPTVIATSPPAGSHGVPQDYALQITFSEAIAHLPVQSLQVADGNGILPVSFSLSTDASTLFVRGPWPAERALTLRLDANLIGASGQPLRDQDPFDGEPYTPFALRFTTGTGNHDTPPLVVSVSPIHKTTGVGTTESPTVCFSKPMKPALVLAGLSVGNIDESTASIWSRSQTCVALTRSGGLRYGTKYDLHVRAAVDSTGIPMAEPLSTSFVTRSGPGRIRINEIVTDPLIDWNDSEGGDGAPFNALPGTGSITTSDEYIELHNGSDAAVSIRGWTLEQSDGSDQVHVFGEGSSVTERFSDPNSSVDAFQPGGYLVVGNLVGDNLDTVALRLLDADGYERDAVTLGNEGVPTGATVFAEEEAVVRVESNDTGIGGEDWRKGPASPGGENH